MTENQSQTLLGAIEAGGTKYVCAVGTDPQNILLETRFPTGEDPEKTINQAAEFFSDAAATHGQIQALGIGTFGPADISPRSPGYGSILTTPKPGWSNYPLVHTLRKKLAAPMPIAFETDVNAAVLAEATLGAGRNQRYIAYVTVGTGIGAAFLNDGQLLHGRMHPEIGHLLVPNYDYEFEKDTNVCPFHQDCLEGRASGTAIAARWGSGGDQLPADHPAWELESRYLAAGALSLTASWSPDIIILGGGVSQQEGLIEKVRHQFQKLAGNYWTLPKIEDYLVTAELDQQAGIVGGLIMAERLLECDSIQPNH